jgi:hypothetical protein
VASVVVVVVVVVVGGGVTFFWHILFFSFPEVLGSSLGVMGGFPPLLTRFFSQFVVRFFERRGG